MAQFYIIIEYFTESMTNNNRYHMPEFPTANAVVLPEMKEGKSQIVNTGYVHVFIPMITMKAINGYVLADTLKESWEASEKVYLEETGGCCE